MKVLITGGFGYLGSRLAQFLISQGVNEIILGSRRLMESPSWLPHAKVVKIQWDSLSKLEEICSGIDVVIHLAGMNAQDCANDPVSALEFNGVAAGRLLHAAMRRGVKRFIYLSTAHVYASLLQGEITEATCPTNLHPYATSHRAGEDVVRFAHQSGNIEGIVIRLSNAFGVPAHKDANCWMLLVNDLCQQAVSDKRLVLHSSGLQRRDFVTLTDVTRAISHLLNLNNEQVADGLFNVGGVWAPSIADMAELIQSRCNELFGFKPDLVIREKAGKEKSCLIDYSIEKLIATGFSLTGEPVTEIDHTLELCRNINTGTV